MVAGRGSLPSRHTLGMGRCLLALLLATSAAAADKGERAEYVGGTLGALDHASGAIDLTDESYFHFRSRTGNVQVAYDQINVLEYGQNVSRRYAMAVVISPLLLMSKSRKHFLTVGYTDDAGKQQALVFRVDKDHIRTVLVVLEAKTGRKVQFQDLEARKAGKG